MTHRSWMASILMIGISGCAIAMPFRGPGYDSTSRMVTAESETVIVALTQATLGDDPTLRSVFWDHAEKVRASLSDRSGFIGYSLRREIFGRNAWTMTVWEDEESLLAFVQSPVHQTAIQQGYAALVDARFARVAVAAKDLPMSWDTALTLFDTDTSGANTARLAAQ